MRRALPRRLAAISACIALAAIAGCAATPDIDGGIVGTGNRIDCANSKGTQRTPEDCEKQAR